MRRFLIILLCVLPLLGCSNKWEWTIPLAVNSTEVDVPGNLAGHLYLPVYSTVQWNLSFDYGDSDIQWLHPDMTSGKGYNVCVRIEYDANPFPESRVAYVVIVPEDTSTGAETIRVRLTQPATK